MRASGDGGTIGPALATTTESHPMSVTSHDAPGTPTAEDREAGLLFTPKRRRPVHTTETASAFHDHHH